VSVSSTETSISARSGPGLGAQVAGERATCARAAPYLTAARSSSPGAKRRARSPRSTASRQPPSRSAGSSCRGRPGRPAARRPLRARRPRGRRRLATDVVARVDREEGEAGRQVRVDVGLALEVVGVGADRQRPAGEEGAEGGVVEHLARRAPGAGVLAHRLLGEDRRDAAPAAHGAAARHGADRVDVPGGGQAEAVAEAGGGGEAERDGAQVGQRGPQGGGVGGVGGPRSDRDVVALDTRSAVPTKPLRRGVGGGRGEVPTVGGVALGPERQAVDVAHAPRGAATRGRCRGSGALGVHRAPRGRPACSAGGAQGALARTTSSGVTTTRRGAPPRMRSKSSSAALAAELVGVGAQGRQGGRDQAGEADVVAADDRHVVGTRGRRGERLEGADRDDVVVAKTASRSGRRVSSAAIAAPALLGGLALLDEVGPVLSRGTPRDSASPSGGAGRTRSSAAARRAGRCGGARRWPGARPPGARRGRRRPRGSRRRPRAARCG
jgi:hypothetical protein